MVIFSLKLLNNLRKAIAGRRFPRQLAGGVALGVLLGIIPHGNLLALVVLVTVLCFQVNHALLAFIAIAASFGATRLDPYSHWVGEYLLTHPSLSQFATRAWTLPLLPWTDLNNTVVLGSFVIGVTSVLPIFYITLPFFRMIAPAETDKDAAGETDASPTTNQNLYDEVSVRDRADQAHDIPQPRRSSTPVPVVSELATKSGGDAVQDPSTDPVVVALPTATKHSISLMVAPHEDVTPPRFATSKHSPDSVDQIAPATIPIDSVLTSDKTSPADVIPTNEQMVSVETRIDVIRMKDYRDDDTSSEASGNSATKNETAQPMDEALNYLLRQLRHSQERKAAG